MCEKRKEKSPSNVPYVYVLSPRLKSYYKMVSVLYLVYVQYCIVYVIYKSPRITVDPFNANVLE